MSEGQEKPEKQLQRTSLRCTKGIPPKRYPNTEIHSKADEFPERATNSKSNSRKNSNSGKESTTMSARVKKLQLELKAEEELAALAEVEENILKKSIERKKTLIKKKLSLEREKIENMSSVTTFEMDFGSLPEDNNVTEWVNNLPKEFEDFEQSHQQSAQKNHTELPQCNNIEQRLEYFMARQSLNKDLPRFSGDPLDWPIFYSQFKETTEACNLSKRENVYRLQKCLIGPARDAVLSLLNVLENLDKIIQTLERRFGRKDYIINKLINNVRRISSPCENKLETLIDFANVVSNLTATIKNLNCTTHLMNPFLLKELIEKLPISLRLQWGEVHRKIQGEASLIEFSEWLENKADAASFVIPVKNYDFYKCNRKPESLLTVSEKRNKRCLLCKGDGHEIGQCNNFLKENVEDRWKIIIKLKLCFICLKSGHLSTKCFKKKYVCPVNNCGKNHHKLLHKKQEKSIENTFEEVLCIAKPAKILLRIAPVKVYGPNGSTLTYALFDEGSTVSIIENDIAEKLGLEGESTPLCLRWTSDITNIENDSKKIELKISGTEKSHKIYTMKNVRTVPVLSLPRQTVDVGKLMEEFPYLRNTNISSYENIRPTILIGQDNWFLTVPREIVQRHQDEPVASKTKLGWVVHGKIASTTKSTRQLLPNFSLQICLHDGDEDRTLHDLVKTSFEIDAIGIRANNDTTTKEEKHAIEIINKTTSRIDVNRWQTGLLWKEGVEQLPESKENALRRLNCMERKMAKDPKFAAAYCNKIEEFLSKGYARKLSKQEVELKHARRWFLPHFAVFNVNKPGKLRFVFDAAARSNGMSLNDALLKGPELLNSLLAIVMKFRQRKIAFGGDIKEMFPQVKIITEDQPAQCFLWRKNKEVEPDVYVMTSMIFGAVCSPCSAQEVKNRNAREFREEFPEAVEAIIKKHYMDDYLDCSDSKEEAIKLIHDVIEVHRRGGFIMCNWFCTSPEVLKTIKIELRTPNQIEINADKTQLNTERVLGLWWDLKNDNFTFKLKLSQEFLCNEKIPTKREILKIVMSIFDPLGFLAHFMIFAKIILQDIWRLGLNWEDQIPTTLFEKWSLWTQELRKLPELKIPRHYSQWFTSNKSLQLHVFCDASERACAAVAYFRIEYENEIDTAFVSAKTRVAPIKATSIPRLELQAALIGARLGTTVKTNHDVEIHHFFYWSDSRTVLSWLKSTDKRFKQFVGNRITEIQELTNVKEWYWVPSEQNVADKATKWSKEAPEIDNDTHWLNGPEFLRQPQKEWKFDYEDIMMKDDSSNETMQKEWYVNHIYTESEMFLPDITRFSKYNRLVRSTAWVQRYLNNCLAKIGKKNKNDNELTALEINEAEKLWIKKVQQESYKKDIIELQEKGAVSRKSPLFKLTPRLDEEKIIRLRGRIDNASNTVVAQDTKNPIILEQNHLFTKLLIRNYHEKYFHYGQNLILNELRQRLWIPRARQTLKKICRTCLICQQRTAAP